MTAQIGRHLEIEAGTYNVKTNELQGRKCVENPSDNWDVLASGHEILRIQGTGGRAKTWHVAAFTRESGKTGMWSDAKKWIGTTAS